MNADERQPTFLELVMRDGVAFKPPGSLDELIAFRHALDMSRLNQDLPPVAEFYDRVVLRHRRNDDLTAEVYVPLGEGPFPTFLYLHGGGWCLEDAASVRRLAMTFATKGYVVVNLNYGLAPEHPFPGAVEDCVYAVKWITKNIDRYGGSPTRVAISGDSAGANLAAASIVALNGKAEMLDLGDMTDIPATVSAAVLFYGAYDFPLALQSPGVLGGFIEVQWHLAYLGPHFLANNRHPLVSPVYADNLELFPPAYLTCGDRDWTLRQTLGLAAALADAGAPTRVSIVPGLAHFFAQMTDYFCQAGDELDRIYTWLAQEMGGIDPKSAGTVSVARVVPAGASRVRRG